MQSHKQLPCEGERDRDTDSS